MKALGVEESRALVRPFAGGRTFVDSRGRIQDTLRKALKDDSFAVPQRFAAQQVGRSVSVLRKLAGRLEIQECR